MKRAHMKRTEPLRISLLRSLATDGSQTSIELTKRLNPYPGHSLAQSRNGVNSRLSALAAHGHARVATQVPGSYHNVPSFLWAVTAAGKRHLADYEAIRAERLAAAESRRSHADHRESALRWLIRTALASKWGPETSAAERRAISRRLREQGMPYDWIAAVFDVSHECVRQDCNGYARRKGQIIRTEPLVVPGQGPGYVWDRTREKVILGG